MSPPEVTSAVKVNDWPKTAGLCDEIRVVVVSATGIVKVTVALALQLGSAGLPSAILCGVSYGGLIALRYAALGWHGVALAIGDPRMISLPAETVKEAPFQSSSRTGGYSRPWRNGFS